MNKLDAISVKISVIDELLADQTNDNRNEPNENRSAMLGQIERIFEFLGLLLLFL